MYINLSEIPLLDVIGNSLTYRKNCKMWNLVLSECICHCQYCHFALLCWICNYLAKYESIAPWKTNFFFWTFSCQYFGARLTGSMHERWKHTLSLSLCGCVSDFWGVWNPLASFKHRPIMFCQPHCTKTHREGVKKGSLMSGETFKSRARRSGRNSSHGRISRLAGGCAVSEGYARQ